MKKSVFIAFLGNAYVDSRIINLTDSLESDGYRVSVTCFDWTGWQGEGLRDNFNLYPLKKSSFSLFFYLKFAFRLIFNLLRSGASIYFAEDIYTLPFVYVIAKIKGKKVYYNSRELYAFLGGLRNKKKLQSVIYKIEKIFIRRVDLVLVTGEMDADFIRDFYKVDNIVVIRNIPLYKKAADKIDYRKKLNLPDDSILLLYQGVILEGRGLSLIFEAMTAIKETELIILGDGPFREHYLKMAEEMGLKNRIHPMGMIGQEELINYTAGADIGMALIENISVSYYHALPNKLFEYIMAELPVLSCALPQMKKIVEEYNTGRSIDLERENIVKDTLSEMLADKNLLERYKKNCRKASEVLNWQEEYKRAKGTLF